MQDTDKQLSFTAKLSVDDKPVTDARQVIAKLLMDPDMTEEWAEYHRNLLDSGVLELSYGEGVVPEIFYFAHHDDVYTIRIKGSNGLFDKSASMEGSPRNLSAFAGDDPTYFRIVNSAGAVVKLNEIPDDLSEVYLYTGPQRRPVKTYAGPPTFPVLTDDPNRSGSPLVFKLKIIERSVA